MSGRARRDLDDGGFGPMRQATAHCTGALTFFLGALLFLELLFPKDGLGEGYRILGVIDPLR